MAFVVLSLSAGSCSDGDPSSEVPDTRTFFTAFFAEDSDAFSFGSLAYGADDLAEAIGDENFPIRLSDVSFVASTSNLTIDRSLLLFGDDVPTPRTAASGSGYPPPGYPDLESHRNEINRDAFDRELERVNPERSQIMLILRLEGDGCGSFAGVEAALVDADGEQIDETEFSVGMLVCRSRDELTCRQERMAPTAGEDLGRLLIEFDESVSCL